jgi:hypothetical protein
LATDLEREFADRVREAAQHSLDNDEDAQAAEGSVATSFVMVVEFMRPDGERFLVRYHADAAGEGLTPWQVEGVLGRALNAEAWADELGD